MIVFFLFTDEPLDVIDHIFQGWKAKLIEKAHVNPCIWDIDHDDYPKVGTVVKETWYQILDGFDHDFYNTHAKRKQAVDLDVHTIDALRHYWQWIKNDYYKQCDAIDALKRSGSNNRVLALEAKLPKELEFLRKVRLQYPFIQNGVCKCLVIQRREK